MTRLEITITNRRRETILHHRFEVSPELAQTFLAELATLLAALPARPRIRKDRARTVIDLTLAPPPPVQPSFETRFRMVRPERKLTDETQDP